MLVFHGLSGLNQRRCEVPNLDVGMTSGGSSRASEHGHAALCEGSPGAGRIDYGGRRR